MLKRFRLMNKLSTAKRVAVISALVGGVIGSSHRHHL